MGIAGYAFVGVSSTYRDHTYQDWLFAQGRTRAGNIVTNARSGQSWHNWRLAFDVFQNIRGEEWNNADFFATAGRIWVEMGGEWGGNWTGFTDRPHMQYTGGLRTTDLQNGMILPKKTTMPWEHEPPPKPSPSKQLQTPMWAADSTAWAMSHGITTNGERPNAPATREEVWAMLHRMYQLIME
jgi:peptidoglycan L-alanyl-D-glutamate endopeptidase CwlK